MEIFHTFLGNLGARDDLFTWLSVIYGNQDRGFRDVVDHGCNRMGINRAVFDPDFLSDLLNQF